MCVCSFMNVGIPLPQLERRDHRIALGVSPNLLPCLLLLCCVVLFLLCTLGLQPILWLPLSPSFLFPNKDWNYNYRLQCLILCRFWRFKLRSFQLFNKCFYPLRCLPNQYISKHAPNVTWCSVTSPGNFECFHLTLEFFHTLSSVSAL